MKNFFQWMEAGKKGETGKNERKGGSRNTRLTYQKWVQTAAAEASPQAFTCFYCSSHLKLALEIPGSSHYY
jgi:hypothetical protein